MHKKNQGTYPVACMVQIRIQMYIVGLISCGCLQIFFLFRFFFFVSVEFVVVQYVTLVPILGKQKQKTFSQKLLSVND